jgi:hypothetical protein
MMEETDQNPEAAATPEMGMTAPEIANPKPEEQAGPIQIGEKQGVAPEERQKQIVDDMVKLFEQYEQWRKPFEGMWAEVYRLYFSSGDKTKTPTRSSITVPVVFQIIEAAVPKIVNSIFGSGEEFFEVAPTDPADAPFASAIQMLLTYQLGQADFMVKFIDFCKQLLLYGTSYFYVYWKVKRQWVYTKTPIRKPLTINGFDAGEQLTWEVTKEYQVVERRPEIEVLDILDVFPDPEARTEKDAKGLFVRSWMDIEEAKELGNGKYPMFANTKNPNLQGDNNDFAASRQTRYSIRGVSSPKIAAKSQIELLTYWGAYDIDGDGIREEVQITIANRTIMFIGRANPFHHQKRPVIRTVFFPIPLEWYGMGLVEPVMSNVHELWTLRRQRIDNINLILNRMWKVSSLADIDLDTLVSTPNGIVITDDMNGVEALETPDVTSSAYNEASAVQNDIENATAPRSVQGTPESGKLGRTAKGAQLIIGQALEKFAVGTKLVEELGIKRVIRMFHQLDLQFIDQDDILRDPGMYGHLFEKELSVEDIRAEVRFKMIGISDMIGTEGKINQIVSWFGVFAPYLDPATIAYTAKSVAKLMGIDVNQVNIMGMANPLGALPPGANPAAAQVMQNGVSAPVAVPGAPSGAR